MDGRERGRPHAQQTFRGLVVALFHLGLSLVLLPTTNAFSSQIIIPPSFRTSFTRLHVTKGDARGAALLIEDVSVSRGPAQILSEVNWRVEPCSKWALLGPNGCGKSTLLKAITGELLYDGSITIGSTQKVGYLQQTSVSGSNRTVYEEAASAMTEIEKARNEIDRATQLVQEDPSEANLAALDRANQKFEAVGGYTQEQEVASVLKGLGFTNLTQTCDTLSGGWQMRVSLAKLLLSKPSLLLLDEPSNHLEYRARMWLANYLQNYESGAMILVTHDISLLQGCVQHIAEVDASGTLQFYKSCSYEQYLEERDRRAEAAVAEYERNAATAAKLQDFVDRWGASATKASSAQSRVKQLEKMEKQGLLDEPATAITKTRFQPQLLLPDPPKAIGETLMELKDVTVGWTSKKPLLSNVNLSLKKGMKLWIKGQNGAGKSTLMQALRGTLEIIQGERIVNERLRLGVFTQDLAQELDTSARALDLVTAYARSDGGDINISNQDARNIMGRLGLGDDKALRRIGELSGGEKGRVALAMFCLKPSNVLLLDEVSNHLDQECVSTLSEGLSNWGTEQAAVVVISHDKNFCQSVGFTHIGEIRDGKFSIEERSMLASDWDHQDGKIAAHSEVGFSNGVESTERKVNRELEKRAFNAPKRIAKLEKLIEEAEIQSSELEEEMMKHGSDVGKLMELTDEKTKIDGQIAVYLEEWESLEKLLSIETVEAHQ